MQTRSAWILNSSVTYLQPPVSVLFEFGSDAVDVRRQPVLVHCDCRFGRVVHARLQALAPLLARPVVCLIARAFGSGGQFPVPVTSIQRSRSR